MALVGCLALHASRGGEPGSRQPEQYAWRPGRTPNQAVRTGRLARM